MKGFTEADWAEYKTKFQQEFTACPEWAEAESIFACKHLHFDTYQHFLDLKKFVVAVK